MIDRAALRTIVYALDGDDADLPFWEGCARGVFLLYRCDVCARHYWPAVLCPEHGNRAMAWVPGSGRGEVHVHTVLRHAYGPAMADRVPCVIGIIRLEEGPFFHGAVVDCPVDDVHAGLRVEAVFTRHASGMIVPQFRRRR